MPKHDNIKSGRSDLLKLTCVWQKSNIDAATSFISSKLYNKRASKLCSGLDNNVPKLKPVKSGSLYNDGPLLFRLQDKEGICMHHIRKASDAKNGKNAKKE